MSLNNSIIVIGDIHGRAIWKNIISLHPNDEIIFVGDYFDSKENFSAAEQIFNFNEILTLKKTQPKRINLLMGNHDFHYLPTAGERYSGYQYFYAQDIYGALKPAIDKELLGICTQRDKYLISHAGLTKTWCLSHKIPLRNPVKAVNNLFYTKPEAFRFSPGKKYDKTGNEPEQGPLWVRPFSLYADNLPDVTQIVGHTQRDSILFLQGVVVVDVLTYSFNYLEINPNRDLLVRSCNTI